VIKIRSFLVSLFFLGLTLVLTGCQNMSVLNPKGLIAHDEKDLFLISLLLMLIIVIPVIILTIVIPFRARATNLKASYKPDFGHSTMIEIICWSIPVVIIIGLGILTWFSTHRLDPYKPIVSDRKAVQIQVVSLNWRWLFVYPEEGIATINDIVFPVGTPVSFSITSTGPMNGFQIPQLGTQIYAMSGMKTQLHLIADEVGQYRGHATNYSGEGFANMHFMAKVVSQKDFEAWVASAKKSPHKLTMANYESLVPDNLDTSVQYFSAVDANLFNDVIMSYMMPKEKKAPSMMMGHEPKHH
jgi:cytochrome o ubiquinol oxidase subunit 2